MNQQDLSDLMRESVTDIAAPDLAQVTAVRAQQVRRRRRAGAVALVAVASAAVVLGVRTGTMNGRADEDPAAPTPSPTSEPSPPRETAPPPPPASLGVSPELVQEPWTATRYATLPWAEMGLPRTLDPTNADASPLSSDPVDRAVAAVQLSSRDGAGVYVFGDDGRWRFIDGIDIAATHNAGGYGGPALRASSLSPDGTGLALPQPDALLVIDLTTASAESFDVAGLQQVAVWTPDGSQVLVSSEEALGGTLVDLSSGELTHVPYHGLRTAFDPDGTALELWSQPTDLPPHELRRYPARTSSDEPERLGLPVDAASGFYNVMPFAAGDALAFATEVNSWSIPRQDNEWPGIAVIDAEAGTVEALLPWHDAGPGLAMTPLGWLDDESVLIRFDDHVTLWDYRTGDLSRISTLRGGLTASVSLPD